MVVVADGGANGCWGYGMGAGDMEWVLGLWNGCWGYGMDAGVMEWVKGVAAREGRRHTRQSLSREHAHRVG